MISHVMDGHRFLPPKNTVAPILSFHRVDYPRHMGYIDISSYSFHIRGRVLFCDAQDQADVPNVTAKPFLVGVQSVMFYSKTRFWMFMFPSFVGLFRQDASFFSQSVLI